MKTLISAIIILFVVTGCSDSEQYDARLEGTWTLDSEMIMKHLDTSNLSKIEIDSLKNGRDTQLVFEGNKVAFQLPIKKDTPLQWPSEKYEVVTSTKDYVTIRTESDSETTYYFTGECIYLINTQWQYNRYFCRDE